MPDEYDFDVAVSFAGEDRTLVAEVVDGLKARGVSVFYDQDFTADMWARTSPTTCTRSTGGGPGSR